MKNYVEIPTSYLVQTKVIVLRKSQVKFMQASRDKNLQRLGGSLNF